VIRALLVVPLLAIVSCSEDGVPYLDGLGEPVTVAGGTFVPGPLPGTPPVDGGVVVDAGADAGPADLSISQLISANELAIPGAAGKSFSGLASADAVAIGVRFPDLGTGYWVVPTGSPDPMYPGQAAWSLNASFLPTDPTGFHDLRFVAIDQFGNAGMASDTPICVASRIPDNYNSCDPTIAPPDAVITVEWDTDLDLDLQVTTPDGRVVDPKHPATMDLDGGKPGPDVGVIDRDSLANCVPDGLRQEDLVFQQRPTGSFQIAVNIFSACDKAGANFTVIVNEATGTVPNRHLVETFRRSGDLASFNANGGLAPGLFVVTYPFGG
jgi:hypothetical protein